MDTKKTAHILKAIKRKPQKQRAKPKQQKQLNYVPVSKDIQDPFWKRIFSMRNMTPEQLNEGYMVLVMDLQDAFKQTYQRFERNKDSFKEASSYNIAKKALEQKIKHIYRLRMTYPMADHLQFLASQDIHYQRRIPAETLRAFLKNRTAKPAVRLASSVVGSLTERKQERAFKQAKMVDLKGVKVLPMPPKPHSGTKNHYRSEFATKQADYSSVPWFPGAKAIVIQEPIEERDGRLYLDNLQIPRLLAIFQHGVWWVRVKKPWLEHVSAHGRPFINGKVGYLLKNNQIHIETIKDYEKHQAYMNEYGFKSGSLDSLFAGVSPEFSQKLIQEAPSLEHLIHFMATLDPSVSHNKLHRLRFYTELYKAKIVLLSKKQLFPEIFSNPNISKTQVAMIDRQIVNAEKRIQHFLATGHTLKQAYIPAVKLPIEDISANINAFWYLDGAKQLRVGDLLNPPTDIHFTSLHYVASLIPQKLEVSETDDVEEYIEEVRRPKLLAVNLFATLEKELDKLLRPFQDQESLQTRLARHRKHCKPACDV